MNTALIISFLIMGLMTPVMFCGGFYFGFNTAKDVFTAHEVGADSIPGVKATNDIVHTIKESVHIETDEERMARILTENIENFGTNIPQKEVK